MFHPLPAHRHAIFPAMAAFAALAALGATAVAAQPSLSHPDAAQTSAPPALTYTSALDGYKPFADEKPIPWKEANETVRRRGGWQAYAKEASDSGTSEGLPTIGSTATPAAPAGHSGHSMPMPTKKEQP